MACNGKRQCGGSSGKARKINSEMIKAYREMARLNLELAEEARAPGEEALRVCEKYLTESGDCGSKERGHILC